MTDTQARFLDYTDKVIRDSDTKELLQGDVFRDGTVFRFKDGKLHGEGEPAIECEEGHVEFWRNGKLHKEKGSAVCCQIEENGKAIIHEEIWLNGVKV